MHSHSKNIEATKDSLPNKNIEATFCGSIYMGHTVFRLNSALLSLKIV
jgi:hypothetical protein